MRADDEVRNAARAQLSKLQTQHRAAHEALDSAGVPVAPPGKPPLAIAERIEFAVVKSNEWRKLAWEAIGDLGNEHLTTEGRRLEVARLKRAYNRLMGGT